ncbi:hypothetical protein AVEN_222219-1 [Araneus ventricosus]|uniref:Uncharacterized protein n=1 Tax=Araneus ventricosus TaxID=182803 RepID=A0A4Y2VLJ6_ARAVE|nr:hypothetical protein AVEN_222219-1 [Araneus ventricosus]
MYSLACNAVTEVQSNQKYSRTKSTIEPMYDESNNVRSDNEQSNQCTVEPAEQSEPMYDRTNEQSDNVRSHRTSNQKYGRTNGTVRTSQTVEPMAQFEP